jgi:hypothetical protein
MRGNPLADRYTLPPEFIPKPDGSKGDFDNKRGPLRKAMEFSGVTSMEQLSRLGRGDLDQIKNQIEYFEQHPEADAAEVEKHFRDIGVVYNSVADLIGEKGREALKQVRDKIGETKIQ